MADHFKNDYIKGAQSQDIHSQPKSMIKHEAMERERIEHYKRWITFYRRNPWRFIESYFGIHLYPFQKLIIWVLSKSNLGYIVASRAASKSWLIAVWALTLSVLYPGTRVIIVSKTIKQGAIILSEKLTALRDTYPNVAREIRNITNNANTNEATFHCGSTIKVVPSSESARGNRANYIIVEEARLVPKDILEQIIKPFLFSRMPPYRLKKPYSGDDRLKEEGIISYITSAWYTSEYWYTYVKSCIRRMVEGDNTANFLAFDYLISIYHNIKTEEMLKNEMEENDPISVQMEYLNIPAGSSSKGYFKFSSFKRNIKRAFYSQKNDEYDEKKNPYGIKKEDGEIRFLSIDVATRAGRNNDNTIICCIRCIPILGKGYRRELSFLESHKGQNTISQALRVKEIFTDFEADYIVLDLQQAGISLYDALTQITPSDERGIDFPAMMVNYDSEWIENKLKEELVNRSLNSSGLPIIFPILGTQPLNSQIAVAFRTSLKKGMWNFLIPEGDAEDYLTRTNKEFTSNPDNSENFSFFMSPYINTGLLIGECVNLDMSLVGGSVKLTEKVGNYKDRYSSISYGNFIISLFDIELLRESSSTQDEFMNLAMVGLGVIPNRK